MERIRMVFSGSGGQGVITAAIIIAEAAVLYENLVAVQSQSYGAEARGGATRSDVLISDTEINFPKVTYPNLLVCLTQEAYNTFSPIIRPGGFLITDTRFVKTHKKVGCAPERTSDVSVGNGSNRQTGCVQHMHAGSCNRHDGNRKTRIDNEGD